MKVSVVAVLIFATFFQVDARAIGGDYEALDPDADACVLELHLNRDKIAAVDVTKVFPENDDEIIQYMGCRGKRMGLISPTGEVIYEKIVEEIVQVFENDPEIPAWMATLFKRALTKAAEKCHKDAESDLKPGLGLIKAMNCIDREGHHFIENSN